MRLSDWAREQGVHYQTAWKWAREGKMPVPVVKTPSGRYLVLAEPASSGRVVGYCRVSSADQGADLERQVGRVTVGALERGLRLDAVVSEVGSGLNARGVKFSRLLADPSVATIVVEHRDRAARFGLEHLQAALGAQGRQIVVLEEGEVADDLVRDLTEILTSLCARLYGRRSARRRADAAVAAMSAAGGSVAS
ncbi:IS607 family transposase [Xylanimonas sp. McL0601]|uniref:IS607 family transposase n=1 Tax=Xylanimonas sp. McL0601 TaxID=3414739 RepID=UPI003CF141B7